jgi:Ser/Thr protein kinase RdoA (MazF antagonist)
MTRDGGGASPLEQLAAKALLACGISDARLELINLSENATFLVHAPGEALPTVLRMHRAEYNTAAEIGFELDWTDALRAEGGVLTPRAVTARDGSRVVTVAVDAAARHFVMFELLPGREPDVSEDAMTRLGAAAGRMHRFARIWVRPIGYSRRTWDFETILGGKAAWGPWQAGPALGESDITMLRRLTGRIAQRLRDYGGESDRFGLIHADLRLGNTLFDGERMLVIDFDDFGSGWFMYDLACAFTFIEGRADVPVLLAALLAGYDAELPLSDEHRSELPTLMLLRRMAVLAWLGSHPATELARVEGPSYARTTCELADAYLSDALQWS